MFALQSLILPTLSSPPCERLYFRAPALGAYCQYSTATLEFQRGGLASFDTFFNGVSIGKWKRACDFDDLSLWLFGEGRFALRMGLGKHGVPNRWLSEAIVDLDAKGTFVELPAWRELDDGILFLHLRCLSDSGRLSGGEFLTATPARQAVKLGAVITHFNRKQWVVPAIRRIREGLLQDARRYDISLVVVDNSMNLTAEEAAGAVLLPNRNYGGSGGFARGLLYLEDEGSYTHCLFMDDDAWCEIESLRRAYAILSYARTPGIAVAGSLLRELEPSRAYEIGAKFNNGSLKPLKNGLKVGSFAGALRAEREEETVDYAAWWFFAFKISQVERYPFPFFVRGDDALFSVTNPFDIVTMNGVACWGEDFAYKDSPLTRYFALRATLALMFLAGRPTRKALRKVLKRWLGSALDGALYESVLAMARAVEDVRKGPAFFVDNLDAARIRQDIGARVSVETLAPISCATDLQLPRRNKESRLRKILRKATLNGLLLPDFLFSPKTVYQRKEGSGEPADVFGYRRICYEYKPLGVGFVVEFDRLKWLLCAWRACRSSYQLLRDIKAVQAAYATAPAQIMTKAFWRRVYSNPAGDVCGRPRDSA